MEPQDTPDRPEKPEPPQPPLPPLGKSLKPKPPAPPPAEMIKPSPQHVPLTPMMEFLQRRLESLERDLESERAKAQAAQNLIGQQEALRSEVDTQLKSLSKQLRREKSERENEDTRSHAKGRIDSLEKRLDEMHQTWASLLQQSIMRPGGTDLKAIIERLASCETALQKVPEAAAEVRSLANRIPADDRRFEGEVSRMLSEFSAGIKDQIASMQRQQALELERQEERVQALARERAALREAWETQSHGLRQGLLKEGLEREAKLSEKLEALAASQEISNKEASEKGAELRALIDRIVEKIEKTPQAKDEVILALETEMGHLRKALQGRINDLRDYTNERRQIEQSMGMSLMDLNRELETEREKSRQLARRISELEHELLVSRDEHEAALRTGEDKNVRFKALAAERDVLVRSLIEESDKVRSHIESLRKSEEDWDKRYSELEQRLRSEIENRIKETGVSEDLRGQLTTLSSQLARTIQEKEAVQSRSASWEEERKKAQLALEKKEEMIGLLSHTFQTMLKKSPDA